MNKYRFPLGVALLAILGIFVINNGVPQSVKDVFNSDSGETESEITEGDNMNIEGLGIEDLTVGEGDKSVEGDSLVVNYKGTLEDGTQFDSSYDRGVPFEVVNVGNAPVIDGWNEGLIGMQVGGKRKLTISPEKGYGSLGQGSIPPNATLIFEVELLEIK